MAYHPSCAPRIAARGLANRTPPRPKRSCNVRQGRWATLAPQAPSSPKSATARRAQRSHTSAEGLPLRAWQPWPSPQERCDPYHSPPQALGHRQPPLPLPAGSALGKGAAEHPARPRNPLGAVPLGRPAATAKNCRGHCWLSVVVPMRAQMGATSAAAEQRALCTSQGTPPASLRQTGVRRRPRAHPRGLTPHGFPL